MKLDASDAKILELCVQELEARTSAEVVLVIRHSSGSYRDITHLGGAFVAWGLLLVAMSVPTEIPEYWLPLPMVLVFWLTSLAIKHSRLRTLFSSRSRKIRQVLRSARACFFEKKVHQTSSHSGILIYCSILEKRVEILLDQSAEKNVDAARIIQFQTQFSDAICVANHSEVLRSMLEVLRSFGVYLGKQMPCGSEPKANELENAPDLSEDLE